MMISLEPCWFIYGGINLFICALIVLTLSCTKDSRCVTWPQLLGAALLQRSTGFQRQNCNKAQLLRFPSAVAFKTCWSWPLRYYRIRQSNCSVQLHFSPEYLNPLMHRDTSQRLEYPSIDSSCSVWKFTRHFRTLFTYNPSSPCSSSHTAVKTTSDLLGFHQDRFPSCGRSITCRV